MFTNIKKTVPADDKPKYPIIPKDAILWSEDLAVMYNDAEHSYTMAGVKLLSATGLIERYKPEFKGTTKRTEQLTGMNEAQVREMWKKKGDVATNRGDYIHWILEQMLAHKINPDALRRKYKLDDELYAYADAVWHSIGPDNLKLEAVLYSKKHMLAGRSDCVHELNKKGHIIDWKTNMSDIHKAYGYMKEPIKKIKGSKLEQYKIQIGIYGVMYEEMTGNEAVKGTIVHLFDGNANFIPVDMVLYKELARKIMAHNFNNPQNASKGSKPSSKRDSGNTPGSVKRT